MPEPEQYNPPLRWYDQAWRYALCLVISAAAASERFLEGPGNDWVFWADIALGVVTAALVHQRRRWPFAVAIVSTVLAAASSAAAGFCVLAFVSLATHRKLPQIFVTGIANFFSGIIYYYVWGSQDPPWLNYTAMAIFTVATAAIGMYIGSRRELLWTLRDRARQAEAEQALRMERARSAERERIAREMHDVLAHRISLVAMHSGALAFRDDLSPDQVRETAALIQEKSHEALADLRHVLGMLRDDEVPHRPQPTMADLPVLVDEARESGMAIALDLRCEGTPPDQVGRTVYRIVQEGLTNARKHGGGGKAHVQVTGGPDEGITVTVLNARRFGAWADSTPRSGLGLVGLRERAELVGGRLETDETPDAFTLRGWVPWTT